MPLDETAIGSVLRFYRDGWRCGHLEELEPPFARIRPIGGGANKHRLAKIPLYDVEEMEQPKPKTTPATDALTEKAVPQSE
jgi:hypothetical protein